MTVYGLFLLTDLSKATIYRWFNGVSRIEVGQAHQILKAIAGERSCPFLDEAVQLLLREQARDPVAQRLLVELKVRRLPRRRTLDALRAAGIPGFE